ncbi:MAG: NACHT domain-containing protein [Cyanobacteria bacterium RU_5_0]|nr:NACHT domain-containing protein [Cyanobacteria bacterium RU_5_0]
MEADDALRFIEELLAEQEKQLNDSQRTVFRGAWQGKGYKEIHQDSLGGSLEHIMRNVGPNLWKLLSEVLGEKVSKNRLKGPIERARERRSAAPTRSTLSQPERQTPSSTHSSTHSLRQQNSSNTFRSWLTTRQDWGTAPDVSLFRGRTRDLDGLEQWITIDGCRLVTLFGMAGIGKTALSVRLSQQVRDQFEILIWRSLDSSQWRNRPPLIQELFANLIQFLSNQQEAQGSWSRLFHHLVNYRCLIILDGFEAVLRSGVHDGTYRENYETYGEFLKQIGSIDHQSCLVLTSREEPKEIATMKGDMRLIRSLEVTGLGEWEGREIFMTKNTFSQAESDWMTLIQRYGGNPFALNEVATIVRHVFGGNVTRFVDHLNQETAIYSDFRDLLDQQFDRLSPLEIAIIRCLTNSDEPVTITSILQTVERISWTQLQEVLQSLRRRSLIEADSLHYSLQPLLMEYAVNWLRRGSA